MEFRIDTFGVKILLITAVLLQTISIINTVYEHTLVNGVGASCSMQLLCKNILFFSHMSQACHWLILLK